MTDPTPAVCPYCGSDDRNRIDPNWYLWYGKYCTHPYHDGADHD